MLAYVGDSVYEIFIREFLVNKGIEKVNDLQQEAIKYVSAKGQAKFLDSLMDNEFLTEEELAIVYRARNHRSGTHPKNTDIVTYKYATGLEAVIGYLYLTKKYERVQEIMNYIINIKE